MPEETPVLTPKDILDNFSCMGFYRKTGLTWIKPIDRAVIDQFGGFITDLEKVRQPLIEGQYLCRGVEGELWTTPTLEGRKRISNEPDEQGYHQYIQINPQPVCCFDIPFHFILDVRGRRREGQEDGAVVTWNGLYDETDVYGNIVSKRLIMRIVKRSVFEKTYSRLIPLLTTLA